MKYREFKSTYAWMLRTYPGTGNLYRDNMETEIIGTCETKRYVKNGRRWTETDAETEPMTGYYYCNGIDAIPFFRGLGGTERVELGHTCYGNIPVSITSTSPDGGTRIVRTFTFDGRRDRR